MKNLTLLNMTAAAAFALTLSGIANSETANFHNPMWHGDRLDWCLNWAQGCGKQAADKFCQTKGFSHAANFGKANDIGTSTRTRLIGTGAVCDQAFCDGFTSITCSN